MCLTRDQFNILEALAINKTSCIYSNSERSMTHSDDKAGSIINELYDLHYVSNGLITDNGLNALEPYRAKRAVFFAAGLGTRLLPITINTPKPLIRVHGTRIIDRLIDACLVAGVNEIYVVRGYLAELFDQLLYKYPMLKFLENPAYNEANNISSFMAARHLLSNAYIIESDLLIYNPTIIKKYHYTSTFLAKNENTSVDWGFIVKDGLIIEEKINNGGDDVWQMVGISYWNHEDGCKLSRDIVDVYNGPHGKNCYWEHVPLIFYQNHYKVEVLECFNDDVIEIDSLKELQAIDKAYCGIT